MEKYDLIIIGAGSAGYTAAVEAGKLGKRVLILEKDKIGGVCLNAGCVPTKTFYQFAKLLFKSNKFNIISNSSPTTILNKIERYKNSVVLKLRKAIEYLFKKYNVHLLNENSILKEKGDNIIVSTESSEFWADKIIIATGSNSFIPEGWKNFLYTPEEFINLSEFPKTIAIIGAGVIGCEFAFIFATLGLKIYLIEKEKNVLPFLDEDVSKTVSNILIKNNVKIFTDTEVIKINRTQDKTVVTLKNNTSLTTDGIIISIGRKPNTGFISNIVKTDKDGFIITNENYQTSNPKIYAIGDVINKGKMFAHLGIYQASELIKYLFNNKETEKKFLPYGIFVYPQVAGIGLTEKETEDAGINYKVHKIPVVGTTIGRIVDDKEGFIKIISAKDSTKILGVHIISENAIEIINLVSTFLNNNSAEKMTDLFNNTIFIHPSESEILKDIEI